MFDVSDARCGWALDLTKKRTGRVVRESRCVQKGIYGLGDHTLSVVDLFGSEIRTRGIQPAVF